MFDKTVCIETDSQFREGLIYLPNKDEPFTGNISCEYENGQIKIKGEVKDGLIDGELFIWYENGQKKIETTFRNGKPFGGEVNSWDQHGQSQIDGEFFITFLDIEYRYAFMGNSIIFIDNYKNKKLVSESSIMFHDNGFVRSQDIDIDGRVVLKTYWDESGKKEMEHQWSYFSNFPEEIALVIMWNKNGQKIYEGELLKGITPFGTHTSWNDNGQKELVEEFDNDGQAYLVTEWYDNGQKKSETDYYEGEVYRYQEWNNNGQKKSETGYMDGKLSNVIEFNEDGQIKSEKFYDEDGVCVDGDC